MKKSNFVDQLLKQAESSSLECVVLRDFEELPEVEHDIDLFVSDVDHTKFMLLIDKLMKIHGVEAVRRRSKYAFNQIYISIDNEILKLDIWNNICFRGLNYLDSQLIIENSQINRAGYRCLRYEIAYFIVLCKELLSKGSIQPEKLKKILIYSESVDNWGKLLVSKGVNGELVSHVMGVLVEYSCGSSYIVAIRGHVYSQILNRPKILVGFISAGYLSFIDIWNAYGKFYVLVGPDGSGKTTVSLELEELVRQRRSVFSDFKYLHGHWGLLPNLGRFVGRFGRENKREFGFQGIQDTVIIKSKIKTVFYMMYYFVDYFLGSLRLLRLKLKGDLVVADRYFYDYFLQSDFVNYSTIMRYIYLKMLPSPDAIIVLKGCPEAIFARKPELTIDEISSQQLRIEDLLKDVSCPSYRIDSDRNINETVREIREKLRI
jgi:thymidylate kinase